MELLRYQSPTPYSLSGVDSFRVISSFQPSFRSPSTYKLTFSMGFRVSAAWTEGAERSASRREAVMSFLQKWYFFIYILLRAVRNIFLSL